MIILIKELTNFLLHFICNSIYRNPSTKATLTVHTLELQGKKKMSTIVVDIYQLKSICNCSPIEQFKI